MHFRAFNKKIKFLKIPMSPVWGGEPVLEHSSLSTSWYSQHIKVYQLFKLSQLHATLEGCQLTV